MCKGASFSLVYCLRLQWSCVYLIHWIGYPDKAPDTSNIAFRNCPVSSDISLKVKEQAGHVRQFPKRKLTEYVRRTSRQCCSNDTRAAMPAIAGCEHYLANQKEEIQWKVWRLYEQQYDALQWMIPASMMLVADKEVVSMEDVVIEI